MADGESPSGDEHVEEKKAASDALKKALDLLSRRDHATAELANKLYTRGYESTVIDGVLNYLLDNNYLNDSRYAEAFVRMRSAKGFGERDIQAKLRARQVNAQAVSDALAANAVDWFELAEKVLAKKFHGEFQRDKAARYLQSRGFSVEQTVHAMEKASPVNKS